MPIPRLTASAKDFTYSTTINKKKRPYFEIWFQRKKQDGETPEKFSLRMLTTQMMNDYFADVAKAEMDAIEQDKVDATTALQSDIELLFTEVD
jgi:hypothetical protein